MILTRFWAEIGLENPRIRGKLAQLRLGNANKGGGGPKTTDPWTKTTKNATNRHIGSNQGKAILVKIFEFLKNEEKFGGFRWKHKSNPCQPRALIPYDAGRSRFSRICAEGKMNTKNTRRTMNTKRGNQTHKGK